jgi:hypothetical protein
VEPRSIWPHEAFNFTHWLAGNADQLIPEWPQLDARQHLSERSGAGLLCLPSGGWLQADGVAEGFEPGDQAAGFPVGVQAAGEEVGAELVVGLSGGQNVPDDDEQGVASLSVDTPTALGEHGSAALDEHYGRSCQPISDAGRRCQHQIGRSFANAP